MTAEERAVEIVNGIRNADGFSHWRADAITAVKDQIAHAVRSASTTREAALREVAAWHEAQAEAARRIVRKTIGEVSMAHAGAAAVHSTSAAAILALIPQPAPAQPSREAPGLKCAIDIANERIATIRHFGGDSGPAEMVRNRLIDALALADKPEPAP